MKFDIGPLVNEMLDKLPTEIWESSTTTFLDPAMAGGQFVKEVEATLREHGHSDENIKRRVFGFESSEMRVNYAVNKHGLVGTYSSTDFLSWETDMKFDVIVGNPPFQSGKGNGSQPIYKKFVAKAMELSAEGGYVSIISPPGFLSGGNLNFPAQLFEKIKLGNLLHVQYDNVAAHFDGIGSLFCYMVWQNSPYERSTTINEEIVDITKMNLIPPRFTKIGWSIVEKITNTNNLNSLYRKKIEINNWVVGFKELNHVNNKLGNIKATIFSPNTFDNTYNFSKVCKDEKEAIHICSYLNGYVGSFYNYFLRHNGVIHNGIISKLSIPPEECDPYRYFNLTQEEIDYIEANVK